MLLAQRPVELAIPEKRRFPPKFAFTSNTRDKPPTGEFLWGAVKRSGFTNYGTVSHEGHRCPPLSIR
jgi:hypothetical protein